MTPRYPSPLRTLGAALLLGLLGQALFYRAGLGLNVFLWLAGLSATGLILLRGPDRSVPPASGWLAVAALAFGAGFPWRDSAALWFLDCLSLAAVFALIPGPALPRTVRELLERAGGSLVSLWGGFPVLALEARREWAVAGDTRGPTAAAGRGLVVATPLLIVFGSMLIAADARFEQWAGWLFDPAEVLPRLVLAGLFAWIAGGALGWTLSRRAVAAGAVDQSSAGLGRIEIAVVLGTVNLLFLGFVLAQLGYFFGGSALVLDRPDLTYAAYARRGFFELVAVSALVLPTLLALSAGVRENRARVIFRWLAGLQIGLVLVIMASAVHRMVLYERAFGLTEARLLATCFMGWLGLVLLWFVATVLRDRVERFVPGALLAWSVGVLILQAMNPAAVVVQANVRRAEQGRGIDAAYLASLGSDGVPDLVAALPRLDPLPRQAVAFRLQCRGSRPVADWREWNLSRARARATLAANQSALQALSEQWGPSRTCGG
jgi:hypothetical protein